MRDSEIASPFESVLGLPATPAELTEAFQQASDGFEEALESCVVGDGFEYHSEGGYNPPPLESVAAGALGSTSDRLRADGYYITTNVEASVPFLTNSDADLGPAEPSGFGEYYQSLTEPEQQAFRRTMSRCTEVAAEISPTVGSDIPEDLLAEIEEVNFLATSGPEATTAWDEWSQCIAEQGFGGLNRAELIQPLELIAAGIQETIVAEGELSAATQQDIDRLRDDEMLVAFVDADCADEVNLDQRLKDIRYAYEEQWLADNEARLALLLGES